MESAPKRLRILELLPLLRRWTQRRRQPTPSGPASVTEPWQPIPWRDLPREVAPWSAAEAESLRTFLRSETGLRVGTMMRALIASEQSAAMRIGDEVRLAWRCGHAAGVQSAVMALDNLARWGNPGETSRAAGDERPDDTLNWLHGVQSDPSDRDEQAGRNAGWPIHPGSGPGFTADRNG